MLVGSREPSLSSRMVMWLVIRAFNPTMVELLELHVLFQRQDSCSYNPR